MAAIDLYRSVLSRIVVAALVVVGTDLATAQAQNPEPERPAKRSYTLATATAGGTYHPVGVALATLMKIKLLPEENIDLDALNSDGSGENVQLLRENQAHLAILQGLYGYYAYTGSGPVASVGPQKDLRAVTMLWPNVEHFIVKKNLVRTGTIDDFLAAGGQRVSMGLENSGTLGSSRVLMENLGVDVDAAYDLAFLGYAPSADALVGGNIVGMSTPAGLPVGAAAKALATGDAQLLEFTDEQLREADGGFGLWAPYTIPAGTYPEQDEDIQTIAQPNFLAVRADVDEDAVYLMTKTIFENLPFLQNIHPATSVMELETALSGLPMPLHPGAARYFREVGLEVPDKPVLTARLGADLFKVNYGSVEEAREQINQGTVSIIAGGIDSTSMHIASDLAAVLDHGDDMRVLAVRGRGAAQAITDLLYLRGMDLGIVQADALEYAKQNEVHQGLDGRLQYIAKLYNEEFHLLVRDDVSSIDDLAGEKVNFGVHGSGSEITTTIVFDSLGIPVRPTSFDQALALAKLEAGEIAGMAFVAGKPATLLEDVTAADGFKLLPVPSVQYAGIYVPARFTAQDYPQLLTAGETLDSIAVSAVMLSYRWDPESDRYRKISAFVSAFFDHLPELQTEPRHPKWREVSLGAELPGWTRLGAASEWFAPQAQPVQAATPAPNVAPAPGPAAEQEPPAPEEAVLAPQQPGDDEQATAAPQGQATQPQPAAPQSDTEQGANRQVF